MLGITRPQGQYSNAKNETDEKIENYIFHNYNLATTRDAAASLMFLVLSLPLAISLAMDLSWEKVQSID